MSVVVQPSPQIAPVPARRAGTSSRDLRLDFFRGLALWFIFIDHVPSSTIANLTLRNFGFSDATEIFVFISGYTAGLVYTASMLKRGFLFMTMQVLKRCWQLYAAHILLFVFFIAQISWVAIRFDNAAFIDELNITEFFENPQQSIISALMLHYRPVNLDVLPLYMALLAGLPLVLWLVQRSRLLTLALSAALWLAVQQWGWAFPVYASGDTWLFNPLAWQLLFVIGIVCASVRDNPPTWLRWHPALGLLAFGWILFGLFVTTSWRVEWLNNWTEVWIGPWLYPIDKNNLGIARLLHFLAMAYLVSHVISERSPLLRQPFVEPIILCGQHALYIFCVSISLSFVAHFFLVEFGRGPLMQIAVIVGGLAIMSAIAWQLDWFRRRSTARGNAEPAPQA